MKKRIACLIMAILMLAVFAACGTGNKDNAPAGSTAAPAASTAAPAETPKAEEPTAELTMAFLTFAGPPKDMDAVAAEINKISKEKINATIKAVPIAVGAYAQQIKLMLASNEPLDIFHTGVLGPIFDYLGQTRNGQLLALNDLLDTQGKEVKALMADYLPCATLNGKIYAIPALKDMAQDQRFIMRKDLAEKYGIDPAKIKTLDDVYAALKIAKQKDPSMTPIMFGQDPGMAFDEAVPPTQKFDYMGDYFGVLMDCTSDDLKLVNYFEAPEYINNVKIARKWYTEGLALQTLMQNKETAGALMKAGKIFSYIQAGKPGIEGQIFSQTSHAVTSSVISAPISLNSHVINFMWGIPNYSKNPEKAMAFINLMFSNNDVENLFVWGIEGKHYVKTDDGHIDFPQGVDFSNTGYALHAAFQFGNQLESYIWKGDSLDVYKELDNFNKTSTKSKAYGFIFDQTNVKNELTALTNVINQYRKAVGSGAVDVDQKLPEFQAKLKAAGIEKVIAEKQKQLDAWKAAKK